MQAPTPPVCVCTLSDKTPSTDKPGWFEYTFSCHWEHGFGGNSSRIDRSTYSVPVECRDDDVEAMNMAKANCPYEPMPGPDDK